MMNLKKSSLLLSLGLLVAAAITLSSTSVLGTSGLLDKNAAPHAEKNATALFSEIAMDTYRRSKLPESGLDSTLFKKAYTGFFNLKAHGKVTPNSAILSIADLSISSKKKRLWIVDLQQGRLLMHTWVAHGQGSGDDVATRFSNRNESHQSSLGFYITGEVYRGKHGRSLRLDGMDKGFNDRARARAIVVHGADYVSGQAIQSLDRLGRSYGCPAVPAELSDRIINLIKDKTVFFVYARTPGYRSAYLNEQAAASSYLADNLSKEETGKHAGGVM